MMSGEFPSLSAASIEQNLLELIMRCPELSKLEALLSTFNIFRVLRADRSEIKHSNMLAWLFNPAEAHGLDDLFLRRWLMVVLQRAATMSQAPAGWISPIAVDVLNIDRVEVHRELEYIDLLFAIHTDKGKPWIVCIENKVDAIQGKDQLKCYHDVVERRFADAERRIYIFLTKNHETPAHPEYVECGYDDIVEILSQCLEERVLAIGPDPLTLIQHYRQLLMEDFVDESEASKLARQIYLRHKPALDFIFENKIDPMFEATNALDATLRKHADELGIVMDRVQKGWIRFLPKAWDVPNNSGGTAWGQNSRYLLCEVSFWTKRVELQMTAGRAPDTWAEKLWARAAKEPFRQEWKKRPAAFIKPFKSRSDIKLDDLADLDGEEIGSRLLAWLKQEFEKEKCRHAVDELTLLLTELTVN